MRPRVFPAEDVQGVRALARAGSASMRPRVFPAEDIRARGPVECGGSCFNEAAGIPRGRRDHLTAPGDDDLELQ